jgi:hypothetical protein
MNMARCRVCAGVTVLLVLCGVSWAASKPNLVAHWEFEEGSGKIAYDSAGTHDGRIVGDPTWVRGSIGSALHLDGFRDYVEIPDDVHLRPRHITISAWINMESLTNHMMVVSKSNYADSYEEQYAVHVRVDGEYWRRVGMNIKRNSNCEPWLGWYRVYSQTLLNLNTWYMVTGTWDGTHLRMYVNGVREGDETEVPAGPIDDCPGGTLRIGRWRAGDEQCFHGLIDDVRLYDESLSEADVKSLFEAGPRVFYVDGPNGSDSSSGSGRVRAFATIQKGIDAARDGDIVLVYPGVYAENVSFKGKAITVRSAEDAAIIDGLGSFGVSFFNAEGPKSVLKNFVIRNCVNGVLVVESGPTLKNLTIVACDTAIMSLSGQPDVSNCILWGNTAADLTGCKARYSCIQRGAAGLGNISVDPLFADPRGDDYHLCSQRGMFWPKHVIWVLADTTSPCIDAGDPADDYSLERQPNGGRIDMGAHGGTPYASLSTTRQ